MSYILVLSTVPTLRKARQLADLLLRKKLAACVNITASIESRYMWKGKQEKAREFLMLIKTRRAKYAGLEAALLKHHPYDIPEIIAVPVQRGSKVYLNWITQETK